MRFKMPKLNDILTDQGYLARVLTRYVGKVPSGKVFEDMVEDLGKGRSESSKSLLAGAINGIAGNEFTTAAAHDLSWRLANGCRVPWTTQAKGEWVYIQVSKVVKHARRYATKTGEFIRKSGVNITYLVLSGSPAGKSFTVFWSLDTCDKAKHQFGFDKRNKEKYSRTVSKRLTWPYLDPSELYRMRLCVYLDPANCPPGELAFNVIRSNTTTKGWNRALMQMRLRDGYVCPAGYDASFACYQCPFGLKACRAACHDNSYTIDYCPECDKPDRFINKEAGDITCIDCSATHKET